MQLGRSCNRPATTPVAIRPFSASPDTTARWIIIGAAAAIIACADLVDSKFISAQASLNQMFEAAYNAALAPAPQVDNTFDVSAYPMMM